MIKNGTKKCILSQQDFRHCGFGRAASVVAKRILIDSNKVKRVHIGREGEGGERWERGGEGGREGRGKERDGERNRKERRGERGEGKGRERGK